MSLTSRYADRCLARTQRAFLDVYGQPAYEKRVAAIAALPTVSWRGRTLCTITCHGEFGKGPHVLHVPEYVLWSLIDLRAFRCPYHA